jgi:hypothetical protein
MNSRGVLFAVLLLVLAGGCGSGDGDSDGPRGATETNVFRCGDQDVVDAGECDGGVGESNGGDEIACEDDEDCPEELPVCNRKNICSPKRDS